MIFFFFWVEITIRVLFNFMGIIPWEKKTFKINLAWKVETIKSRGIYRFMEIVGSQFSDRAHYNEFVESGAKSWAVMRRRLVLGMKGTHNRAAQSSQEEGTPRSRTGMRQPPLDHAGASLLFLGLSPFFAPPSLDGLCCYLFLSSVHPPPTLVSHPCLSSSARPLSHSF